jgi:hypothetical protein
VPNLDRVERLLGASHWVHHDAADRVTKLLINFFAPLNQPRTAEGIAPTTSYAGRSSAKIPLDTGRRTI